MARKYIVTLSAEERQILRDLIASGTHRTRKLTRARIPLKADEGWSDREISRALNVSIPTIERVRRRFVFEGFEAALDQKRSTREYHHKIDGEREAQLIALMCSDPSPGQARWSLRLLADRFVELEYIDSISHETVRQVLNANELKPWRKQA